jgi:putative SOS response-associated peptidase YedK
MCGRYELHSHPAAVALAFGLSLAPEIAPRYNIAPMQDVPVIRLRSDGARELSTARWGLVPRWAKDPSIGNKLINARGETLAEKPSFRMAFKHHRCLIPANGFYEWMPGAAGGKQPIHIGMKDGALFAFAGVCERWMSPEGDVLDTCSIATTSANALLAVLHERMPVIIPPEQYERWLDVSRFDVQDLLEPYPAQAMRWYPVSTRVNSVRNDDAALLTEIVDAAPPEQPIAGTPAEANAKSAADAESGDHCPPEQKELV